MEEGGRRRVGGGVIWEDWRVERRTWMKQKERLR